MNSKSKLIGSIFLIALIISIAFFLKPPSQKLSLNDIPLEDRTFIEKQFQQIFTNEFGYTLEGTKPVSWEEFVDMELSSNQSKTKKIIDSLTNIFANSTEYFFFTYSNNNYYRCTLVNKKALLRVLKNTPAVTSKVLPKNKTLEDMIQSKEFVANLIDMSGSETLSILLGFGLGNGRFFDRRAEIADYLNKFAILTPLPYSKYDLATPMVERMYRNNILVAKIPYKIEAPEVNPRFKSFEEEWKWIESMALPAYHYPEPPYMFCPPAFVMKKSYETKILLKRYEKSSQTLGKLFENKSYLEAVMDLARSQ